MQWRRIGGFSKGGENESNCDIEIPCQKIQKSIYGWNPSRTLITLLMKG